VNKVVYIAVDITDVDYRDVYDKRNCSRQSVWSYEQSRYRHRRYYNDCDDDRTAYLPRKEYQLSTLGIFIPIQSAAGALYVFTLSAGRQPVAASHDYGWLRGSV